MYIGENMLIYFSMWSNSRCCKLELIQYKRFSKLATVAKPLSFKQL